MTAPYLAGEGLTLHLGDCREVMATLPDASVDAVVTDPPYGLEFMGREWDAPWKGQGVVDADAWNQGTSNAYSRARIRSGRSDSYGQPGTVTGRAFQDWCQAWAAECLRVLKPGGHLLAFGGTRTWHRLACAVEDAGFEIRDTVADLTGLAGPGLLWIHGQGFPKSLDVSKAIDKTAGAQREVVGKGINYDAKVKHGGTWTGGVYAQDDYTGADGPVVTAPATEDATRWEGWGTALKPAWEPIVVARKPLAGTVAANVLEHGTGALNVDGCRVRYASPADQAFTEAHNRHGTWGSGPRQNHVLGDMSQHDRAADGDYDGTAGRWPPNLVLAHTPDCQPAGPGQVRGCGGPKRTDHGAGSMFGVGQPGRVYGDHGWETVQAWDCAEGCPVAELDRQSGITGETGRVLRRGGARQMDGWGLAAPCEGVVHGGTGGASRFFPVFRYEPKAPASERPRLEDGTAHPTVKPVDLIRWLVRLVTPPGGTVLDPFAGTGTTGEACVVEGFRCVLVEQDPASCELARLRLSKPIQPVLDLGEAS